MYRTQRRNFLSSIYNCNLLFLLPFFITTWWLGPCYRSFLNALRSLNVYQNSLMSYNFCICILVLLNVIAVRHVCKSLNGIFVDAGNKHKWQVWDFRSNHCYWNSCEFFIQMSELYNMLDDYEWHKKSHNKSV